MFLGAIVDAGVPLDAIVSALQVLEVEGWALASSEVIRGGIGATRVEVNVRPEGVVRTWGNIRELLERAALPDGAKVRSLRAFERLARAESQIHRVEVDRVHFHEVGGIDAIIDIAGTCVGWELLGVERVTSTSVVLGTGMTRSAHGLLPVPAPAVVELLRGAPTMAGDVAVELCTPTGAALLAELVDVWSTQPPMVTEQVGYGAGSRDIERPNVLRMTIGAAAPPAAHPGSAVVLETTIDDMPGELVPPVLDALRAAGASDAWARPVLMKKGRPGLELACIAPEGAAEAVRRVLFTETTTLGVRGRSVDKWTLDRDWVAVDVEGAPVRLKIGLLGGEVVNVAPEFSDCQRAAETTGLPLKEVFARARAQWQPPPHRAPS